MAAARAGARGVLIARPRPADPEAVRDLVALAPATGAVIAVDSPSRLDPAWNRVLPALRESLAGAALLDTVAVLDAHSATGATDGVLDAGLIEQVALVRSLTGRLDDVRGSRHNAAYHVSVGVDALAVNLAGTITSIGAAQVRLDLIAPTAHWQVRFDASTPANATRIARYDATGGQIQPTLYESGRRAVWRHMAAAITDGEPLPYSLSDLADDILFVRDVTRQRSAPEDAQDAAGH